MEMFEVFGFYEGLRIIFRTAFMEQMDTRFGKWYIIVFDQETMNL